MELLFALATLIFFFFFGAWVERKHLRSLDEREAELEGIVVHQLKSMPPGWTVTGEPVLLSASVVLANDYFKSFKSALKKLIGGNLTEHQRLMERGRREAIVRLKQEARNAGCNVVWNVRLETSMMQEQAKQKASSGEFIAYGTGMRVQ